MYVCICINSHGKYKLSIDQSTSNVNKKHQDKRLGDNNWPMNTTNTCGLTLPVWYTNIKSIGLSVVYFVCRQCIGCSGNFMLLPKPFKGIFNYLSSWNVWQYNNCNWFVNFLSGYFTIVIHDSIVPSGMESYAHIWLQCASVGHLQGM